MSFKRSLHKIISILIVSFTLPSCNNTTTKEVPVNDTISHEIQNTATDTVKKPDIDTSDFAIEYIAIADTGFNYYKLRAEMFDLHKSLGWPIDTMGRFYNPKQNKIVLPDTAEDEIYRGEYFERRFPSENMSLEYYKKQ